MNKKEHFSWLAFLLILLFFAIAITVGMVIALNIKKQTDSWLTPILVGASCGFFCAWLLYFPIWQGSGKSRILSLGGALLKSKLEKKYQFEEIGNFSHQTSPTKNKIQNYNVILNNLRSLQQLIKRKQPNKIFTIGGDCSTAILPLSYLSKKYRKDLGIVWFDAHGDINTPESSPSQTLHGMPLRVLLKN